ncbi:SPFH domain-containing protein [Streptomyces sp. NBC_00250]|nr:SPFH domain-containing protein [Streptomyces sp. NBC_00250]
MPSTDAGGHHPDNVSVKVDAVVYFRVVDPAQATIEVQDYVFAVGQVAQSSLRSIIGKSDLDDLLSDRERLHEGLALMIDSPAAGWGVHIDRVEIKDVQLPESLKRSMSRQAEAERERRARVITADGEFQAAQQLANASRIMADTPEAMQLRLLQTVVEVAAEKNSTLVMPFPVELLRYFDRAARQFVKEDAPEKHVEPGEPGAGPFASGAARGGGQERHQGQGDGCEDDADRGVPGLACPDKGPHGSARDQAHPASEPGLHAARMRGTTMCGTPRG